MKRGEKEGGGKGGRGGCPHGASGPAPEGTLFITGTGTAGEGAALQGSGGLASRGFAGGKLADADVAVGGESNSLRSLSGGLGLSASSFILIKSSTRSPLSPTREFIKFGRPIPSEPSTTPVPAPCPCAMVRLIVRPPKSTGGTLRDKLSTADACEEGWAL